MAVELPASCNQGRKERQGLCRSHWCGEGKRNSASVLLCSEYDACFVRPLESQAGMLLCTST